MAPNPQALGAVADEVDAGGSVRVTPSGTRATARPAPPVPPAAATPVAGLARTAPAARASAPARPAPQARTAAPAAPLPAPQPPADAAKTAPDAGEDSRLVTPSRIGFALAVVALVVGYLFPTQRYIVPESGIGYALGIIGGSSMLLLLLYPARKRWKWVGLLGTVKGWFQAHMVLGIVGPLLILYHSNFSLGATNSNAALIAMLLVAGSGVFGRYFYTRIHFGLYGRKASRAEMQAAADELREKVAGSRFVPDLLQLLDAADRSLLAWKGGKASLLIRPPFVTARMLWHRWRITRRATAELAEAARQSPVLREQHEVFARAVKRYIRRRLEATRRVAEFESYERLFSLWHLLHLPLFFMLLIAGIVHVIAVHVY
ncbi:MAG: hypothetical protein U1F11_14760 [Steroidobacteraceae bacterium]